MLTNPASIIPPHAQLTKNERIKQSLKTTKEKRKTQAVSPREIKIITNKLSPAQKEKLHRVFLEAKWLKNSMVAFSEENDINDYNTKHTTVAVRMGKDSDIYEERELKILSASTKQKMKDLYLANVKTLATQKKNGRKVGKIDYVKEVSSIPIKQYRKDYKIVGSSHVVLPKIGKVRVRGLDQISQDADIANAELIHRADGYYLVITTFIPLAIDTSWINNPDGGLDFGIKDHITDSDGEKYSVLVEEPARLRNLQRSLRKKVKGSKRYLKTLSKIRREYKKMSDIKNELARVLVHDLLNKYRFIYIQDENLTGWKSGLFGKQVHHSIMGRVKKLLVNHPRVAVLKRSVPTTQYCPECGALNKTPLSVRVYSCACGYSCERDTHSARNMVILAHVSKDHVKKDIIVSTEYADSKRSPVLTH